MDTNVLDLECHTRAFRMAVSSSGHYSDVSVAGRRTDTHWPTVHCMAINHSWVYSGASGAHPTPSPILTSVMSSNQPGN